MRVDLLGALLVQHIKGVQLGQNRLLCSSQKLFVLYAAGLQDDYRANAGTDDD